MTSMNLSAKLALTGTLALGLGLGLQAQTPSLAQTLLRQLIDINTTDAAGTTVAAQAVRQRLLDAGFDSSDIHMAGASPDKQNLVVRLHGSGAHKPILLIGHLDVVQARRADWSTDPFQLIEKDGFYYGRGTQDMKEGDAIFLASLIRMKQEGYKPDRDIILALTAAEEGGTGNGVSWLLKNHREWIDAAFVINADGGGVDAINGKPVFLAMDASEKLYADFQLSITNPGGHSSEPVPDNAIYHLANALVRLQRYTFPFELNSVTRGFFDARSRIDAGQRAADEKAILATPSDTAAQHRLAADAKLNAMMRTTCVATRLNAGDANNALPQNAEALVNCRIMPGHSAREIQRQLVTIIADPKIRIQSMSDAGVLSAEAPDTVANPPIALSPEVMRPLRHIAASMWNGIPVVPDMAAGASDGKYTNPAGMPTYTFSGIAINEGDYRAHGRDERVGIASFQRGAQFYYRYLKLLTGGRE